jgi:hypothetical protein
MDQWDSTVVERARRQAAERARAIEAGSAIPEWARAWLERERERDREREKASR